MEETVVVLNRRREFNAWSGRLRKLICFILLGVSFKCPMNGLECIPGGLVARFPRFHRRGLGSIPGQGISSLHSHTEESPPIQKGHNMGGDSRGTSRSSVLG